MARYTVGLRQEVSYVRLAVVVVEAADATAAGDMAMEEARRFRVTEHSVGPMVVDVRGDDHTVLQWEAV